MPTGSGLDAQCGIAAESTWGTAVTVTRFLELQKESLAQKPGWQEPSSLRPGVKHRRASRVRQSSKTVEGDMEFEWATKGMGLLVRHMLGSPIATPTLIVAGAYRQAHVPGDFRGLGLTAQIGRPEPGTGTVRPHTYIGCKIPSWEFSLKDQETPRLKVSVDGRREDTAIALASASYLAGATTFDFSQATLKLGGTATTTSGVTSIAGGTAVATVITDIMLKGETPMANARRGLGNAGLKSEQLENNYPTITGSLSAEFARSELYDPFVGNTTTALELVLTGGVIGATAENYTLSFILPAMKIKEAAPTVDGPDVVKMSLSVEGYSDETTNPPIQILIKSDEAAI